MSAESLTLIIAVIGSSAFGSILTWLFTRRHIAAQTKKTTAETISEEVDTSNKVSNSLDEMRVENVDLIKKNFELEKVIIEKTRLIEVLTGRLESRETQLESATKQLNLLRGLAEQAPILETLRMQLEAVTKMAGNMQTVQLDLQKMLGEKKD
jgi:hypothetical protein